MKKLIAIVLCLLMSLSLCFASAETAADAAEALYEGAWVRHDSNSTGRKNDHGRK